MSKSKTAAKAVNGKANGKPAMNKVKDGRVAKATESVKAKADIPKVANLGGKSKKSKKAATSSPSSESESDSDSDASAPDDASSASDASSESESDEETVAKPAAPKVNGSAKLTNGDTSDGSESDDEDESDDEAVPPKATKSLGKTAATAAAADSDGSESSSESDSESESESEAPEKQAAAGQTAKAAESDSESDSDDSSESDKEETAPVAKKRKAEVVEPPVAKKTKTETASAGSANLFVGNLSWNLDEEWLSREFSEYGEVIGCRIITDRDSGRSKGFGYVEFSNAEDGAKALEAMKGYELDGRALNVDFSTPRGDNNGTPRDRANSRADKFGDATSPPSDTLWVGNLPWGTEAEHLREAFEEHGAVASVRVPTDRETGEVKGFGYVSFGSIDEAKAAHAAMKGQDFGGRPMRIDFSGPKPERSGDANGFRGGRGGGGGGGGFRGGRGGGDRGGRGGGFRGGRGDSRGGRGGRGGSTNRGGIGDFSGKKMTF